MTEHEAFWRDGGAGLVSSLGCERMMGLQRRNRPSIE